MCYDVYNELVKIEYIDIECFIRAVSNPYF